MNFHQSGPERSQRVNAARKKCVRHQPYGDWIEMVAESDALPGMVI